MFVRSWPRRRYLLVATITISLLYIQFFFAQQTSVSCIADGIANDVSLSSPEPAKLLATFNRPHFPLITAFPIGAQKLFTPKKPTTAPPILSPPEEYLAICLSVKDQSLDLNEFFTHHYHHHSIHRFYIMDDGSSPPLSNFTYPGIPREALTFTYQNRTSRVSHMQLIFYNWCLERYSYRHKWIAFLDADEYIETPGKETLREVLESLDGNDTIDALGMNWKVHTSSSLTTRPSSSRKAFTTCAFDGNGTINTYIKSIVKTSLSSKAKARNPHKFRFENGIVTVGENGDVIDSRAFRSPVTREKVAVHHFAIKSKAEFEEKLRRGNGMSDQQSRKTWERVENEMEKVECGELVGYEP